MKPNKEPLAYAEKMRKAERRRKTEMATVKFSDLGAMIRETEMYRAMDASAQSAQEQYERQKLEQQIMYERKAAMGYGVTGIGLPSEPTRLGMYYSGDTITVVSPGMGYINEPIPTHKGNFVPREQFDEANEEIARLKAEIAERDEIIDALVQDAVDIEALREENEALKAMAEPDIIPVAVADDEGWISWELTPLDKPPVHEDTEVAVILRCDSSYNGNTGRAGLYVWNDVGQSTIVKYRLTA